MKCPACGEEVSLYPSAAARAEKYGGVPSDYTRLFLIHAQCQLDQRAAATQSLMEKVNAQGHHGLPRTHRPQRAR